MTRISLKNQPVKVLYNPVNVRISVSNRTSFPGFSLTRPVGRREPWEQGCLKQGSCLIGAGWGGPAPLEPPLDPPLDHHCNPVLGGKSLVNLEMRVSSLEMVEILYVSSFFRMFTNSAFTAST